MTNPFFRLSLKQKMFFARHMAIMTRAGMRVVDVIKTMKRQAPSGSYGKLLDDLASDVKNGQFLADSLAKHRGLFGDFFINIIKVGEVSGTLADNLEYLADSLKKKHELQSKVQGALIYPVIILISTLGMAGGMMFFIFPKILPIFKSLKVELPLITKIFIGISNFLINHGLFVLLIIAAGLIVGALLLRIKILRYAWHRAILMIPFAGSMVRDYNMVNFSRSLALLLKSGVKIVQALEITSSSTQNLVYKAQLKNASIEVGKGELASKTLAKSSRLFPITFTEMIGIGEETGKLAETASYLSDYFEQELDASTKSFSDILEPVLLLTMGGIVMFIALSIILPIYKVTTSVHG